MSHRLGFATRGSSVGRWFKTQAEGARFFSWRRARLQAEDMKKNHPHPTPCTNLVIRLATFALLLFASGERLCATPLQLTIQTNGALGFVPSAVLSWDADPGSVYLVQSKSNLADGLPWTAEEPVQADVGPLKWMAPEA